MDESDLEALIRAVPFFAELPAVDVARLVGGLVEGAAAAGSVIVVEGAEADGLYLLSRGAVDVRVATAGGDRVIARLDAPAHFGDVGLVLSRRTGEVRAITDAQLWKLPRPYFSTVLRERPQLGLAMATAAVALLERHQRELIGASVPLDPPRALLPQPTPRTGRSRAVGALLALGVPGILWLLPSPAGLGPPGWHAALVLLGAVIGWLLEPVEAFVVALFLLAAWGLSGEIPIAVVLRGFASGSWLIAVSAFGLTAAMADSGLLFRISLFMLKIFPKTHRGQVLALLVSGLVVTPLVPLALARVAAAAPLSREVARRLGYLEPSRASAAVAFAALLGYGAFSSVFLSGLVTNFFIVGLLPPGSADRTSWLGWLGAAAPFGALLFAAVLLIVLILFRAEGRAQVSASTVRRQERALGKLTQREVATIAGLVLLLGGLVVQSALAVDPAWTACAALAIVLAGGALDSQRFRSSIDWGFLLLFGVLLGAGGVLHSTGVDRWVAGAAVAVVGSAGSPAAIVLVLAVVTVLVRLVLPWVPAMFILGLIFVPVASDLAVSPWLAGFVILVASVAWLNPRMSDFGRLMREGTAGELFTERDEWRAGLAFTVATLVAIGGSIPVWQFLGLL